MKGPFGEGGVEGGKFEDEAQRDAGLKELEGNSVSSGPYIGD